MKDERDLSAIELKNRLTTLTIGGANGPVDSAQRIIFLPSI